MVVVTTVPLSAWVLMRGQLQYLSSQGYDVLLVSSAGELLAATGEREHVDVRVVKVARDIRPLKDVRSLIDFVRLYRAERPVVSLISTPKASLLAGIAGLFTGVPIRVYVLRGLRLETTVGLRRIVLWIMEWITIRCAHHVIAVSPSLLARVRTLGLDSRGRGLVLGRGASNGIDTSKFATSPDRRAAGQIIRDDLGIPREAFVFGFVGRVTPDKGVAELISAFEAMAEADRDVWLMIVGGEDGDSLSDELMARLENSPRIVRTGWSADPSPYYQAMDCFVLPTYREGFPNVCIEAAAARLPVITTNATGAVDSVIQGRTGLVIAPRDSAALLGAMNEIRSDPDEALAFGEAGELFATTHFRNEVVWGELGRFLRSCEQSVAVSETTGLCNE